MVVSPSVDHENRRRESVCGRRGEGEEKRADRRCERLKGCAVVCEREPLYV